MRSADLATRLREFASRDRAFNIVRLALACTSDESRINRRDASTAVIAASRTNSRLRQLALSQIHAGTTWPSER
jgi:hypothetical protein